MSLFTCTGSLVDGIYYPVITFNSELSSRTAAPPDTNQPPAEFRPGDPSDTQPRPGASPPSTTRETEDATRPHSITSLSSLLDYFRAEADSKWLKADERDVYRNLVRLAEWTIEMERKKLEDAE